LTPEAYEACCLALTGATVSVQWGGSHVYKVGGKMFATAWGAETDANSDAGWAFAFKVSDMAYELLIEQGLAEPAPYLARARWVQLVARDALPDHELAAYLAQAHALIAQRLTRAQRKGLGLP
jgi:predicted DNA-binding protein (MmcQ/YjbR family)